MDHAVVDVVQPKQEVILCQGGEMYLLNISQGIEGTILFYSHAIDMKNFKTSKIFGQNAQNGF